LQIRCQILVFYAGVTFFLGTSAVAVSATHVALSNFGADFVNAAAVGHHAAYVVLLLHRVAVIKLQYANVGFAAVNAGMIKQISPDPHACPDLGVIIFCPLRTHLQKEGGLSHRRRAGRSQLPWEVF